MNELQEYADIYKLPKHAIVKATLSRGEEVKTEFIHVIRPINGLLVRLRIAGGEWSVKYTRIA
jgi:hypothetical protein